MEGRECGIGGGGLTSPSSLTYSYHTPPRAVAELVVLVVLVVVEVVLAALPPPESICPRLLSMRDPKPLAADAADDAAWPRGGLVPVAAAPMPARGRAGPRGHVRCGQAGRGLGGCVYVCVCMCVCGGVCVCV